MIKIAFTGDIMLSRGVGDVIDQSPILNILDKDINNLFKEMDYVVGNMECPISDSAPQINKTRFKANSNSLKQVEMFDLFSLANNHIFDCGKSGAIETICSLVNAGKEVTGLLSDKTDYYVKVVIAGKSFAFLSCATQECIKDTQPTDYPQIIKAESAEVLEQIKNAKNESDFVILLVHGSDEMIPYPEPGFRNLCESYIDNGADVVFTHHPHVLGGVHHYNNKFIFYSLGDFIFDGESNIRRRGAIVKLLVDDDNKVSYKLIPTQINENLTVTIADDNTKNKTIKKWQKVSNVLQTDTNYHNKYKYRYVFNLIAFQLDRMQYLVKYRGITHFLKFGISKLALVPFYFNKIMYKNK